MIITSFPAPPCYRPRRFKRGIRSILSLAISIGFRRCGDKLLLLLYFLEWDKIPRTSPWGGGTRTSAVLWTRSRGARWRVLFPPQSHLFHNYPCCLPSSISAKLKNTPWALGEVWLRRLRRLLISWMRNTRAHRLHSQSKKCFLYFYLNITLSQQSPVILLDKYFRS